MAKKTSTFNWKNSIFEILSLCIFWILLTYNFSILNVLFGVIISISISRFTHSIFGQDRIIHYKLSDLTKIMLHSLVLIKDIYFSTFKLCIDLLTNSCNHIIFPITVDVNTSIILISISNSITLTPGTITVDGDKNSLTILSYSTEKTSKNNHSSNLEDTFKNILLKK